MSPFAGYFTLDMLKGLDCINLRCSVHLCLPKSRVFFLLKTLQHGPDLELNGRRWYCLLVQGEKNVVR